MMAFCPNCGNEIRNGVKFCTGCGRPVDAKPQGTPKPQYQPSQTTNKAVKKGKPAVNGKTIGRVILGIIFAIVFFGIVIGMRQNNTSSDEYNDDYSGQFTQYDDGSVSHQSGDELTQDEQDIIGGREYIEVFESRGIYDESALAGYGLSTGEFVWVDESSGMVDKMEYGYKNDVVEVVVETIYYPISNYSDDEKSQLLDMFKSQFAAAEALDFVNITYDINGDYCKIKIVMENMDKVSNVKDAISVGIVQADTDNARAFSYEQSQAAMLASGYIQK